MHSGQNFSLILIFYAWEVSKVVSCRLPHPCCFRSLQMAAPY